MKKLDFRQCWNMDKPFFVILLLWTVVSCATSNVRIPRSASERLPWVAGPHPHRIYNATTRGWSSHSSSNHRSLHGDTEEQTNVLQYQLWESHEIAETLSKWAEHYPSLLRVTTSQEAYGLPTAGGTNDCPFDDDVVGCKNRILLLQDFDAHPEGSPSSLRLPEVLWSGELHGDERVGPTAVLEAAQLLLDAAACEALPRRSLQNGKSSADVWKKELERAHECRHDLQDRGIDDRHRQWLARLLTTRRLVIVPTANALGYYQNRREENRIDPNRDFPYDQTDPKKCMQTIAGRTLNEIFQQHMFQLSLTFHGGMEVVGYEWGAPSYLDKTSPDDKAQHAIAAAYSRYAGGFGHTKAYDFGPMNDLVYPVNGGMEDWAYAGSWDPDRVIACNPITYDGYAASRTKYDNATLRVFNMLVETSDDKEPKSNLGTSLDIMNISPIGNGHVARNIRLALMALELVEPYVVIRTVQDLDLSEDLVPLEESTQNCPRPKEVSVPRTSIDIDWTVGGALHVDESSLFFGKWDTFDKSLLDCETYPDWSQLETKLTPATAQSVTSGETEFGGSTSSRVPPTVFSAAVDLSMYKEGDRIAVVAVARVDQHWAEKVDAKPPMGPQSHIVNARTNENWRFQKPDGKLIQGRLAWLSVPLTLVVQAKDTATKELSLRYDESQLPDTEVPSTNNQTVSPPEKDGLVSSPWLVMMLCIVAGVGIVVGGRALLQQRMRHAHRERVRDFIEDPDAVTPGLQSVVGKERNGASYQKGYTDDEADVANGVELGTYT